MELPVIWDALTHIYRNCDLQMQSFKTKFICDTIDSDTIFT